MAHQCALAGALSHPSATDPASHHHFGLISGNAAHQGWNGPTGGYGGAMKFLLWLIAVALVIVGIVQLFQGQIILGIVLIVAGFLVGPGGYSIFDRRRTA
jgi:hypothetical protein